MAESTRHLYYQRSGFTHQIKAYTTSAEVGANYLDIYQGNAHNYVRLGTVGTAGDSHLRVQKGGSTWAVKASATEPVDFTSGLSGPGNLCINTNNNYLYVANGIGDNVTVHNKTTGALVTTIATGDLSYGIEVNNTTNKVFVSSIFGISISVINGSTNTLIGTYSTSPLSNPYQIAINTTTNKVYAGQGGGTESGISVMDGSTYAITNVSASEYIIGVGVHTGLNRFYGAKYTSGALAVYNGTNNSLITNVTLTGASNPQYVCIHQSANKAYTSNYGTNNVSVVNLSTNTFIKNIPIGAYPREMGLDATNNLLYVCRVDGVFGISVIDTTTDTLIYTIPTSTAPRGVIVDPATGFIYVSLYGANTVRIYK